MSPIEFEEWYRDWQLERWDETWLQASVIATQIINEIRQHLIQNVTEKDLLPVDKFVPKPSDDTEEPPLCAGLERSLLIMRAQTGV